jgi:hypothetical protein
VEYKASITPEQEATAGAALLAPHETNDDDAVGSLKRRNVRMWAFR